MRVLYIAIAVAALGFAGYQAFGPSEDTASEVTAEADIMNDIMPSTGDEHHDTEEHHEEDDCVRANPADDQESSAIKN